MMKQAGSIILLLLLSRSAFAMDATELKSGDLILQSNPCFVCQLIEAEENSIYSHIGVVITPDLGEPQVLEAWGITQNTPLSVFLSRRKKSTQSLILRPQEQLKLASASSIDLMNRFTSYFAGKSYDPDFLWNNRDENGETLYCSEFVAKFINPLIGNNLRPKAMHFEKNREAWFHYFRGNPPDGLPGMSPGDFERSPHFKKVGLL